MSGRREGSGETAELLTFAEANAARPELAWRPEDVPAPDGTGRRVIVAAPLDELERYLDWSAFYAAFGLRGGHPQLFDCPADGGRARRLFDEGQALLRAIVDGKLLQANAVWGLWPAGADGNDLVLFGDPARRIERARFPMLRQQARASGEPCLCLADFVAPLAAGLPDHVGAFAVTAGLGAESLLRKLEREGDPHRARLCTALADRLAEAFAELLHQRARRAWGYGRKERLLPSQLATSQLRGIRPTFGFAACPDATERRTLFSLLEADRQGLKLTQSAAVYPTATLSGLFLHHPRARYFAVGPIGRDQATDYARRKGVPLAEVERSLAEHLGYDPTPRPTGAPIDAAPHDAA